MRSPSLLLLSLLAACDNGPVLSDDEGAALAIVAAPLALNLEASRSAEAGRGLKVRGLDAARAAFEAAHPPGPAPGARAAAVAAFDALAKHQICLGRLLALPPVGPDGKGRGRQQAQHRQCELMFRVFLDQTAGVTAAALPVVKKNRVAARAARDEALGGDGGEALDAWCRQRPDDGFCASLGG